MAVLDSGARREFSTGATRDIAEGKGRCDLLPLDVIAEVIPRDECVLKDIDMYIRTGKCEFLIDAIIYFANSNYADLISALLDVSIHYEDGAKKYAERNWEKGIPLHCFIDSGVRHYLKFSRGDTDERHDRAFLWNMLGAIWTQRHKPELIDLPFKEDM